MTDQYPLYTVLDVGAGGDITGQHVEVHTSLDDAKSQRDELHTMAVDDRENADFRVYQLVEPGSLPLLPALNEWPISEQRVRLEAARLAVERFKDVEPLGWGELIDTANAIGAYIQDGTVPDVNAGAPPAPTIQVRRSDRDVQVWIDGKLAASTDYDQSGHAGMDAVAAAAVQVALACDVEPEAVQA
jgi:hypothetical protein